MHTQLIMQNKNKKANNYGMENAYLLNLGRCEPFETSHTGYLLFFQILTHSGITIWKER